MNRRRGPRPIDVPPGYPWDYRRQVRLSDGRRALIRPVLPDDAGQLADAVRTADADTLRRRFLGMTPHLTPALLTHLCVVDYRKRFALVAEDPRTGHGVAIARYEATDGEATDGEVADVAVADVAVADVAVAVDPAWRGIGLATALVEMLAEAALERGIRTFSAYYFADNRPVAALLDLAGGRRQPRIEEGVAETSIDLDRATVTAAAGCHPRVVPSEVPPARAVWP